MNRKTREIILHVWAGFVGAGLLVILLSTMELLEL